MSLIGETRGGAPPIAETAGSSPEGESLLFPGDDATQTELTRLPAEALFSALLRRSLALHASDLYLLTEERGMTVSCRQWGVVRPLQTLSREKGRQLISYIKAMAEMDIAEHRRPLDGRWIASPDGKPLDLRINTIPTLHGEDMTLRLLSREMQNFTLPDLGMSLRETQDLQAMLASPSGLLIVCGPTGSGKTTTLYTCLAHLNNGQRKINTIEDPIEYGLAGVRQSQINPRINVEYSDLLKSILRQAPDVIMIGEIRDAETASTAVRAANSGHLVLATLHAPVAAGAVQSLLALGVHPHFLSTSLLGIIAQRLVRRLCLKCRKPFELEDAPTFDELRPLLAAGEGERIYGPGGCDACFHDGHAGRCGVFEIMTFDRHLRRLVADARPSREIETRAIESGMIQFRRAAMIKVAQGVTSMEEVLRNVPVEYLDLDD